MKICVDIQPAVTQRAGVGRFTQVLSEHLVRQSTGEDQLRLFYFDFKRKGRPVDVEGAELSPCRWLPGSVAQQCWKRLGFPPFNWFAGEADLYHFNNFVVPPLTRGKSLVTVYDMSFLRHPECAEEKNRIYLEGSIRDSVRRADGILTISQFSADEIVDFVPEAKGRVHVAYPGIGEDFGAPPECDVVALKERLGLERPYILTVGTVEPRKNLPFLVDAFELLDEDVELVVAGGEGWKTEPIMKRFRESSAADRIRYVGRVDDADLPALYAGASVYAIPSLYEGFGFPPLEAMACGTPVVSSTGGSLPEVLGDAAAVIAADDPARWAEALRRALVDDEWRKNIIAAGREQAARYRWTATAEATWRVYRELLGRGEGQ